jgi:hypothetical protein
MEYTRSNKLLYICDCFVRACPTGLGRWKGTTYRGSGQFKMSVITAYRTCGGNIRTSPLGSTFSREFNYFRRQGHKSPNPRRLFFHHLEETIVSLQSSGNSIVLMLDANSDYKSDTRFPTTVSSTQRTQSLSYHTLPT